MGVIAHEDFGLSHLTKILASFMTAAAIGILIFDFVVFDMLYKSFSDANDISAQTSYGRWNIYIFGITLMSSIASFMFSSGAYMKMREKDKGGVDKIAEMIQL